MRQQMILVVVAAVSGLVCFGVGRWSVGGAAVPPFGGTRSSVETGRVDAGGLTPENPAAVVSANGDAPDPRGATNEGVLGRDVVRREVVREEPSRPIPGGDLAMLCEIEQARRAGGLVAALDTYVEWVRNQDLSRDLEVDVALKVKGSPPLTLWGAQLCGEVRRAAAPSRLDPAAREVLRAGYERASRALVAIAVSRADGPDQLVELIRAFGIGHTEAALDTCVPRAATMSAGPVDALLGWLRAAGRHQDIVRVLDAWTARNPDSRAAHRYRLKYLGGSELDAELAGFDEGDRRSTSWLTYRLASEGREQEVVEIARTLAEEAGGERLAEALDCLEALPFTAQDQVLEFVDDEAVLARGSSGLGELSPAWQRRILAVHLEHFAHPDPGYTEFEDVASLIGRSSSDIDVPAIAATVLEQHSVFASSDVDPDELIDYGVDEATVAYRIGHRDLAIRWTHRLIALAEARGEDADVQIELRRRLRRMQRGVDPELP